MLFSSIGELVGPGPDNGMICLLTPFVLEHVQTESHTALIKHNTTKQPDNPDKGYSSFRKGKKEIHHAA